jgi:eukaryotic translation initiation factor 2C
LRLQRFIAGIRVITNQPDESGKINQTPRVVKKITNAGASDLSFQLREGGSMTVSVSSHLDADSALITFLEGILYKDV